IRARSMCSHHGRGSHERDTVVRRILIRSSAFVRAAKRLVKKRPDLAQELQAAMALLLEDALHPKLKTHKLKGELEGSWAASVGYNLRIVFQIIDYEGSEAILLQTVGTHDEVY
ncbi:MAG: type II toxin-antitoxin system mRNA interferase toxin, RelE/StbE family, partial [Pseudomonadota bacterium]